MSDPRRCALDGCDGIVDRQPPAIYCGDKCLAESKRRAKRRRRLVGEGVPSVRWPKAASGVDKQRVPNETAEQTGRQAPLPKPRVRLSYNSTIRIGPDRPAPNPRGMMFRDDLAAMADHGSAGRVGSGG